MALRRTVEDRKDALRGGLDRLDQAFVFEKSINRPTYERQRDLLREEVATAHTDLPEFEHSHGSLQGVLAFIEDFVTNVSRLWLHAAPDEKKRLQTAVVPTGIDWDGATFGTATTAPIFNVLAGIGDGPEGLAPPAVIEGLCTANLLEINVISPAA